MPHFVLPRDLEGNGLAYLHCTNETAQRFRFDRIATRFAGLLQGLDPNEEDLAAARYAKRGDAYRIAVPEKWGSGAWAKVRFRLAKRTPKKTLEVIGRHLDEERIDWLFFTDESGTQLRGARFRCHHITPGV